MPWKNYPETGIEYMDEDSIINLISSETTGIELFTDGTTVARAENTSFSASKVRCRELTTPNMEALEISFRANLVITAEDEE